jgi:L-alanine-DL-glutamate epimerase-like enolase superfamily enzyme
MPILHHPFLSYVPGWLHSIGCFGNLAQLSCENQPKFRCLWANSFGVKSPSRPAFPKEDVAVCRAVREAVGDDMVLMLDPWGVYTLEEAIWIGLRPEELDYYFLEHPMHERLIEPYRKLCNELRIPVCGPELAPGGLFSRAE